MCGVGKSCIAQTFFESDASSCLETRCLRKVMPVFPKAPLEVLFLDRYQAIYYELLLNKNFASTPKNHPHEECNVSA